MKPAFGMLLCATLVAAAFGCASNRVKTKAASDIRCPFDKIKITELDNGGYRAEGCGQVIEYFCNGKGCFPTTGGGGPSAGGGEGDAPSMTKKAEPADSPDTKVIKRFGARFKVHGTFQKDKAGDAEIFKDEDEHHTVQLKVGPHGGDETAYLDQNFAESKRWSENDLTFATKMDAGGTKRVSVAVLVKNGKAYELSCTSDDAASTKTDATCMKVLRSLRVE